ncbi:MAG: flagellar basal body rod modification protein [Candidatus Diapherotrites archaeon ADurb.Bin253]|nr:MAG: flagellar basal body rod modification protein [Candidatus Diapherotrites archaeon ADurb.Bin253]
MSAFNQNQAKFTLINPERVPLEGFSLSFQTNLTNVEFIYSLNGSTGILHIPLETNLNDSSNPEISFILKQNYPNPFNSLTCINFSLPEEKETFLEIYNMRGQLVKTLINELKSSGMYNVLWDGRDNSGHSVSSGIYLYVLKSGDKIQTRKMLFLK